MLIRTIGWRSGDTQWNVSVFSIRDRTTCSVSVFVSGAVAVGVDYPAPVCAVRGSTITLLCTFTPLQSLSLGRRHVPVQIVRVRWCQNHLVCQRDTPSVYDSNSTKNDPRYKYLGDKTRNCTLQITDVQEKDEATLRFRMEANNVKGHFTDQSGVNVTVSGKTIMFAVQGPGSQEPECDNLLICSCLRYSQHIFWSVTTDA